MEGPPLTDDCVYSSCGPTVRGSVEIAAQGAPLKQTQSDPPLTSGSAPTGSSAEHTVMSETVTMQAPASQPPAELMAIADLMERWAAALPRWDSDVTEPWFVF